MKINLLIVIIGICFSKLSFGQKETPINSRIRKVTVFFQGAQLDHTASAELKPGRQELVFVKLTDFVDPNTVQVKAVGDLTILSVRTRKNFEDLKITNSELDELNAQKQKLLDRDQQLRDEFEILTLDRDLLMKNRDLKGQDQGLKVAELKEAYSFMHDKLVGITQRQTVIYKELEELSKKINQLEQEIYSRRSKPVRNYTEIIVEADVESTTSAEFMFSYISPNASWKPYYDMRSDGIGKPVRLEAKAFVSQNTGVEWENIDLVLSTNDPYQNSQEPNLQPWYINYYNYPQQKQVSTRQIPKYDYSGEKLRGEVIDASTGEPLPFARISFPGNPTVAATTDFDGKFEVTVPRGERSVSATFIGYSRADLQITAPYLKFFLNPEELTLEEVVVTSNQAYPQATNVELRSVNGLESVALRREGRGRKHKQLLQAYNQDVNTNSLGGANYQWSPNVQTVAIKKDLRMEYAIQVKMSIPSDGNDHRVHISDYELPANYEYHAAPKLDNSVYLSALVSGWEKLNLLSGESNLYFDGTFIGKSYVDVNSTKDTLSFSLGKDNKIQLDRTRILEKSTNRVIGSRQKFEVAWEIKIRNNGGANIPIVIKDQFPISNHNDIKVKIGDHPEGNLDEKTGILTWNFKLTQGQSKSLTFDYAVDYMNGSVLYLE